MFSCLPVPLQLDMKQAGSVREVRSYGTEEEKLHHLNLPLVSVGLSEVASVELHLRLTTGPCVEHVFCTLGQGGQTDCLVVR